MKNETLEDILKREKLRVEHSEAEDREPIDFDIRDTRFDERCATVWGSEPWHDVQADCEHPEHMVEYTGDDLERGHCTLCGAECDWHWETDEGDVEDYHWNRKIRVPTEWHGDNKGGIIGKILEQIKKHF